MRGGRTGSALLLRGAVPICGWVPLPAWCLTSRSTSAPRDASRSVARRMRSCRTFSCLVSLARFMLRAPLDTCRKLARVMPHLLGREATAHIVLQLAHKRPRFLSRYTKGGSDGLAPSYPVLGFNLGPAQRAQVEG